MSYVMGVDVGSQSVKGVLLDPDGRQVAAGGHGYPMSHPAAGWAEQDPLDWYGGLAEVSRRLVKTAGIRPGEVGHLCLASQVDGVVVTEADLTPRRPAIIWLDCRATAEAAELAERVGADRIFAITGLNADALHVAPKIAWLRRHEPEVLRLASALLPVGGWLLAKLTGVLAQDPANASSTMLFDVTSGNWSDELLAAMSLDPALLGAVRPSTEVAGTLTATAAGDLGLSTGCRVLVGTGDEHAASVGAGAVRPGIVADVAGTAEPVTVTARTPVFDPTRLVETHAHALPGLLLVENPGFVSGGCTLWLAGTILGLDQGTLIGRASTVPAGSDGALFLPTLSGATTPVWDDRMRGVFAGLSMNHGPAHLARAVIEGCVYALRDIVDRLGELGLLTADSEIRVVGGGARSALWLQIKADVLNRPVRAVRRLDGAASGAALLAGLTAGTFDSVEDAVERGVDLDPQPYLPDPHRAEIYTHGHAAYRRLFYATREAMS
ncbi:xylulokinase [Acrocarpospora macrocephala]|uniref:Xylulokinase n=1 Tax=Acrocarpospora macrocephala TaxID=150177 RepID=A0A5M3WXR5_9ACTN|nr:FGGY family carbohydrate kinase [Acrocarpospora macrocephala]GES14265.1 xylulokinase [Acrocarpospora macrocephala]